MHLMRFSGTRSQSQTTFLISSASFLQPSWISTVTFHQRSKASNMYLYDWSKLLVCDNTQAVSYYIHDTQTVSDYVLLLHNTKFAMPLRLAIQCQLNKKPLMYQKLIIVYFIVIMCSQ